MKPEELGTLQKEGKNVNREQKARVMMGRGSLSKGSIHQRKSDSKWVVYTRVHGQKKHFYASSRKGVVEKLRIAQQSAAAIEAKQTMKQYLEAWLETRKVIIKPETWMFSSLLLHQQIIPQIGHLALQHVTSNHIQSLQTRLLNAGLTPCAVRYIMHVLSAAFRDAVRARQVVSNPCKDVEPPANTSEIVNRLSERK